jgi:hypothetical protein
VFVFAVTILAGIWLPASEPEDVNASGGKVSIRAGGARIRTMARSTGRRAITRASLVVATRIRSSRTARGDATPVQHNRLIDFYSNSGEGLPHYIPRSGRTGTAVC